MKKLIYIFLLLFVAYNYSWSQGTDSQYSPEKIFISFTLQPSQTSILNKGVYNSSNLVSSSELNVNGGVELGFKISKNFSLVSGLGLRSYSTSLSMGKYNNIFDSIDSENDSFEMRIVGTGIIEKQKIAYLSIPIKIHYNIHITTKIGAYISSGIIISVPISKNFIGSGKFDYNGYYPEYNITLHNLPQYGFPGNVNLDKTAKLDIVKYNLNLMASAGFTYRLNSLIGLSLGFYYDQSLSNISNYSTKDFQLTKQSDEYNSLMGSASDVRLKAIGSWIAVNIYL